MDRDYLYGLKTCVNTWKNDMRNRLSLLNDYFSKATISNNKAEDNVYRTIGDFFALFKINFFEEMDFFNNKDKDFIVSIIKYYVKYNILVEGEDKFNDSFPDAYRIFKTVPVSEELTSILTDFRDNKEVIDYLEAVIKMDGNPEMIPRSKAVKQIVMETAVLVAKQIARDTNKIYIITEEYNDNEEEDEEDEGEEDEGEEDEGEEEEGYIAMEKDTNSTPPLVKKVEPKKLFEKVEPELEKSDIKKGLENFFKKRNQKSSQPILDEMLRK